MTPRLADFVVVANRLPFDRHPDSKKWIPSPGGLVTALRPVLEATSGAWIGWPGEVLHATEATSSATSSVEFPALADSPGLRALAVNLDEQDFAEFYEGFSNATLWPLYHDLIVKPRFEPSWWQRYKQVNQRYAEAVARSAAPSATVWVQDYQLHLVPGMLRRARPDVRIGFFLHIPFPSPELFRQLPWRQEILEGTLGADVIGFHTLDSAHSFLNTLKALGFQVSPHSNQQVHDSLRAERTPEDDSIVGQITLATQYRENQHEHQGTGQNQTRAHQHANTDGTRNARVGVFPISIDSRRVQQQSHTPETLAASAHLRAQLGAPKILLAGVDRMDYTKGILHRLVAVESLLDSGRLSAQDIVMVQVATPSRERLEDYRHTRADVERAVSRINGRYGQLGRPIIHYIHRSLPFKDLLALYAATDIMLVTAVKDGMNLVAKEYVAAHADGSGALVLSEFTGAATQLSQAYLCNPHDHESLCHAIVSAVEDPPAKKRRRMTALWEHVDVHDVQHWAATFLGQLGGSLP